MTARLYDVEIAHVRTAPVRHAFRYRSTWWLVDVDAPPRLPALLRPFVRFEARDHLGDPSATLRENVEAQLHAAQVPWDGGSITLLTTPRSLGGAFNPLSLFWCRRRDGSLAATLAEVHNTYGGRHVYIVHPDDRGLARGIEKRFYVSPFNAVDGDYTMSVPEPDERLAIAVTLHREGAPPFVASVRGTGSAVTTATAIQSVLRVPAEWLRTVLLIRFHGLRLWARGLPVQPRPAADEQPHDRTLPNPGPDPGARMTDTLHPLVRPVAIDAARWPDVARVPPPSVRSLVARAIVGPLWRRLPMRVAVIGDGPVPAQRSTAEPTLLLRRPERVYRRLGRAGTTGFGEAYMAGEWDSPQLADLLTVFADRLTTLVPRPLQRLRRLVAPAIPADHRGTLARSRPNIAAHYDLSDELFATFLDSSMTYSSGLYDGDVGPGDGGPEDLEALARAQQRKIDAVLDLAGVGPGSRVLEIGTGWGALAVRAVERGASIDTVTLSERQAAAARRLFEAEGIADSARVLVQDYRETSGRYDAIVSVEMIEAVGAEFWPVYFRTLAQRLAPGGRIAVQAILMPHEQMLATRSAFTWIQKYIFPGGFLPSVRAIEVEARRAGLRVTDSRAFGADYARTLATWRSRFESAAADVDRLGFDEVFRRMWSFYLAYSEAGFRAGYLDVRQLAMEAR